MRRAILTLAALAILIYAANPVEAVLMTYEEQGVATGTLTGFLPFNDAAITITGFANSATIQGPFTPENIYFDALFADTQMTIYGVLSLDLPGNTIFACVNQARHQAGLTFFDANYFIVGTTDNGFSSYDLTGNLGPITGAEVTPPVEITIPTDYGDLHIDSSIGASTFTATVDTTVPEPSTLLLIGPGLVGLWVWGRKKFKCI